MGQYLQEISVRGQKAQQITDDAVADMTSFIAQGKKTQARKILTLAAKELRILKQEITQISADSKIDAQTARAKINKRGRTVSMFLGRDKFGNAVRGGLSQGRVNSRTNLAQEQNMVYTESRNAQRFIDQCLLHLEREKLKLM